MKQKHFSETFHLTIPITSTLIGRYLDPCSFDEGPEREVGEGEGDKSHFHAFGGQDPSCLPSFPIL